jgi:hypothetical protein
MGEVEAGAEVEVGAELKALCVGIDVGEGI